jgi:hypothetical protein
MAFMMVYKQLEGDRGEIDMFMFHVARFHAVGSLLSLRLPPKSAWHCIMMM